MARTSQALSTLLAVYSSLANAALDGQKGTITAGSYRNGTVAKTSLTTSSNSSILINSFTLLPSSSTLTTSRNATADVPLGTGLATLLTISLTGTTSSSINTALVGTGITTASSTSLTVANSSVGSNTTGISTVISTVGTTLISSSSISENNDTLVLDTTGGSSIVKTSAIASALNNSRTLTLSLLSSSKNVTRISATISSGLPIKTSTITSAFENSTTSTLSSNSRNITLITTTINNSLAIKTSIATSTLIDSGTTTTSLLPTSTAIGFPVVTNSQCKGPDCNNGVCTGILCVSLGCSGSGCKNGICLGLDCISLGCIGGGCLDGVCTGSCVTSGCKGPDCDTTTGICSGFDCVSVGCSGSDCNSSTGACSGPNCSTKTCSGSNCDKGSCTGSGCDDEDTRAGGGTDAPTGDPTSPTLSPTSSQSLSCSLQTATMCAAACSVTAIADPSNSTTTLTTSCYKTACSATAACSAKGTTSSSIITSTSTSSGACMTIIPFSAIASPGSVVSSSYSATTISYTVATVTANSTSLTGTDTSSGSTIISSAIMTNSNSSITLTRASASAISCTYESADPDQGTDGYCICSGTTYSVLTGTSGNLCAYTTFPTSTAVITASAQYTTTVNCNVCTVYGLGSENCASISGCTPTLTTTVATTLASPTTAKSPKVTCTSVAQCPICPEGEDEICAGLAGEESCGCTTASKKYRIRQIRDPEARREDYNLNGTDYPLFKRAYDEDIALSCPYTPPPEDTACTDSILSKRDTSAKLLRLPWLEKRIRWSNYASCSADSLGDIANVPKFYHPAGTAQTQGATQNYDPTLMQSNINDNMIAGMPITDFANDHVFEAQLISGFLSWLCDDPYIKYNIQLVSRPTYEQIPWPGGWTKPDKTWCGEVFGSDGDGQSGFLFPAWPGDASDNNFVGNSAGVVGGLDKENLMAIYHKSANTWKGKIAQASWPTFSGSPDPVKTAVFIRDTANVFQYLRNPTIQNSWVTPSKSIETICVMFDNNFWTSTFAANAPGTALVPPSTPRDVTNWGLRTLWAFWIDNHLYMIERQVPYWVNKAISVVGANSQFAQNYMQANGMVSSSQMHFPLDANNPTAPIPGTQGSSTSTVSRYMMWDGANYGALGL